MSRDWQKDMELVERFKHAQKLCNGIQPTFHGMISMPEPVEIALEYWLQQSARWKAEAFKSEVSSHEYKKNFNDCFELLERIKKEVDEFRSLLNVDIIECATVIDQVSAFNEYIKEQRERADTAEAKAGFWEMEYYALQREYNEYRTIYPPAVLEEEEAK